MTTAGQLSYTPVGDLTHSNALVSWYDGSIMEQLIDAPVKVRNERPILFSGEMVKAILDGRKTQTRRIINPQPTAAHGGLIYKERFDSWDLFVKMRCRQGVVGDRLWVKETFQTGEVAQNEPRGFVYRATDPDWEQCKGWKWKPSIFMPRKASRITLEITNVRVERLQDISEEDAKAEGVHVGQRHSLDPNAKVCLICGHHRNLHVGAVHCCPRGYGTSFSTASYKGGYKVLWESINGKGSWDANPWVWAITFKRV